MHSRKETIMEVDPKEAAHSLKLIEQAEQVAARHSHNNGIIQLAWGFVILIALPLYDLLPSPLSSIVFVVIVLLAVSWSIFYAWRIPIQPRKWKYSGPFLFLWWGLYYALVLFGGIYGLQWLLHGRPPFMFTAIAIVAAAPLLYVGWRLWRQAHRQEM
jgi:hypothetical protein